MYRLAVSAMTLTLATLTVPAVRCEPAPAAAGRPAVPGDKIILVSPLTHSDWSLHPDGVPWGPPGVKRMLDLCKEAGFSKVLWRAFDSGRAMYSSALADPAGGKMEEDNMYNPQNAKDAAILGISPERCAEIRRLWEALDYAHFDSLAEAVRYGHSIGLEIHAWITINEDDHGWGCPSRFDRAHPGSRWRRRDGGFYHSQQSFAYPEVREYKLAIVKELLANYDIDGVFLDWLRTGDIRDNPQTDAEGVADYGYEDLQVEGFRREFGSDPRTLPNGDERWVRYRSRGTTEFMRAVRRLMKSAKPALPLSIMVAHPWSYRGAQNKIDGNLRGMLLDVETWAREGLFDAAVPAGYYRDGGTPASAYQALRKEVGDAPDVWYYGWIPGSPEAFEADFKAAKDLGASTILLWEADYIDRPGMEAARQAMHAKAFQPGVAK
jgi:hypothetical protein